MVDPDRVSFGTSDLGRPRLLDLSRLVSRLGQGALTGIDRVELAYLKALLARDAPFHALVRRSGGFCLLDRAGAASIADLADGRDLPMARDLVARMVWRLAALRARAETAASSVARDRCPRTRILSMLARNLPRGLHYLNVGHSNLDHRVFAAVRALGGQSMVLVHDVIPLDHPDLTRPDTVAGFDAKLDAAAAGADLVVCNSHDTAARLVPHLDRRGRLPDLAVAHLGLDPMGPPGTLPSCLDPGRPIFAILGTIEPRKNHALLLDVWADLARNTAPDRLPQLAIIGRRGWNNAAVFARLDARPVGVVELGALDDAGRSAVLRYSRALLFPSLAEGYGLPAVEAASIGLPVLATPLPVFREILGEYPVYLSGTDVYSWARAIAALAAEPQDKGAGRTGQIRRLPTWADHFNSVLSLI